MAGQPIRYFHPSADDHIDPIRRRMAKQDNRRPCHIEIKNGIAHRHGFDVLLGLGDDDGAELELFVLGPFFAGRFDHLG